MNAKDVLNEKPKQVVKRLLDVLPARAKEVLIGRYGLGKETKKITLEAIGKKYGITRERVRQIENYGLSGIRKSDVVKKETKVFDIIRKTMDDMGGIVSEKDFLEYVSKDQSVQNAVHFLLVIGDSFKKEKEDEHFKHRWHIDEKLAKKVHEALKKLYDNLDDKKLLSEVDIVTEFLNHVEDVAEHQRVPEVVLRWLGLSKKIGKNPLGEWGLVSSSNVKAKGIRDYAFLVLRKHGSPIHFKDVASEITKTFGKKAHVATTHNELIRDDRFVLVGRGLYALTEWGYMSGVVKDVIKDLLKKHGPLTRDEIIEKVLKERYVKENTIIVNLQNPKYFARSKDGKYSLAR